MLKGIKVSTKITILVMAIALVAVFAIGFFTFEYNQKATRDKWMYSLAAIAQARTEYLTTFFAAKENELKTLQQLPAWESIDSLEEGSRFGFEEFFVITQSGTIQYSTDRNYEAGKTFTDPDGSSFASAQKGIHFSSVFKDKNKYYLFGFAPVTTPAGNHFLIGRIGLNEVFNNLTETKGFGNTGEIMLVKQDNTNKKILLASPLRFLPNAAIKIYNPDDPFVQGINRIVSGTTGMVSGKDYRGMPVYYTGKTLPLPGWAVIGKMDVAEADGDTAGLIRIYVWAGICIVLFSTLLTMMFSRSLTRPLNTMRQMLGMGRVYPAHWRGEI